MDGEGVASYNFAQVTREDIPQLFIECSNARVELAREVEKLLLGLTEVCGYCDTQDVVLITVTDLYADDLLTVTWKTDTNTLFVQLGANSIKQLAEQLMELVYCTFMYSLSVDCEELPICKALTRAVSPPVVVIESPQRNAYLAYMGMDIPIPPANENVE